MKFNFFSIVLLVIIAFSSWHCFADEAQMRNDESAWDEIISKGIECQALNARYIRTLDTNMIEEIEITIDDKQKSSIESDYDTCKADFQTSAAKF